MAIDREATLKKAEKLLRQGRLDAAIVEYARVVEDHPRDWTTMNALGDLYVRAGNLEKAAAQYSRIADHFMREGFLPKAAALYKKILKIRPQEEVAHLNLAEISAQQGLLADAKSHFAAILEKRRTRGDRQGAMEIVMRLASLDPSDVEARRAGARVLAESGDAAGAADRLRQLAADLTERGRPTDALDVLREVVGLDPADVGTRSRLAAALMEAGDVAGAREYLTREAAGDDPALLVAFVEIAWRDGRAEETAEIVRQVVAAGPAWREAVMDLAWRFCENDPAASFLCVDALADADVAGDDWVSAASVLHEFVSRVPGQIPALMKLVEICVDGGLEGTMYQAQAQLADAYLASGQAAEARVIAEDLVAREPWERAHIHRFREALVQLREPDPDAVIAARLSGQAPFTATDLFADVSAPAPGSEPGGGELAGAAEPGTASAPPPEPAAPAPPPPPPAAVPPAAPSAAGPPAPGGPLEIDLTGALTGLSPEGAAGRAAPASLDEVFQDLRTEASRDARAQAAAEQYKLALSYRDMGMVDEAIAALETAVRSPRHRFDAASLLSRLYRERGQIPYAIDWMERAAQAPAPTPEAGLALLYELGTTLEATGETARALAVFLELQADRENYRDVAQRIERLSRVQAGG